MPKKKKTKKSPRKIKEKSFFKSAEKQLTKKAIDRARIKAAEEIFSIRLAQLRENQGITQLDVKGFTQSNVSRLESRSDMKLSTLLEYLDAIDMAVEIKVRPKGEEDESETIELLKTS